MTTILAIETCTNICSVSLYYQSRHHELSVEEDRMHSQVLLSLVDRILKKESLTISDVNYIACTLGPGSFTGVRIGVSVAKGLAYGQDLKIIPICPLLAVARQVISNNLDDAQLIRVILDARMEELYTGLFYYDGKKIIEKESVSLKKIDEIDFLPNHKVCGTGILAYRDKLNQLGVHLTSIYYPMAKDVAFLALDNLDQACDPIGLVPRYIRNSVTS